MVKPYIPNRGDIIWITLDPQAGHEQAGRRPALVISPMLYNQKTKLCLIMPVTNQKKGYPFEVELPLDSAVSGVVLSDQIKSLDWQSRKADYICSVDEETIINVIEKLQKLI
jgi:mRNA interferase MazF